MGIKKQTLSLTWAPSRPPEAKTESLKTATVDVIIPTLGRKDYLENVLKDLAKQSHLPTQVIIVEQHPDPESQSELTTLLGQDWPFVIKHHFIHQTGACNARNLALTEVQSDWVFLNDDDIRCDADLIENILVKAHELSVSAINLSCLQAGEKEIHGTDVQWQSFGSGCSVIKSSLLKNLRFDGAYEHGYGEDLDFGMQLRHLGEDIIYCPDLKMLHLKAPSGGFRFEHSFPWQHDELQPKPSPTVMLNIQKYLTTEQQRASKIVLFMKFYSRQSIKNPFVYIRRMNQRWQKSVEWSKQLGPS
jgi:GT2 family glycosyltransferase